MITIDDVRTAMAAAKVSKPVDDLDVNKPFADQGIDSLDVFNLLLELQEKTGKEVSDEDVGDIRTVNDLLDYFS